MSDPRRQHYIFAHIALPALYFRAPTALLDTFAEHGAEWLQYIWRQIGLKEGDHDEPGGQQISVEVNMLGDHRLGLITLPAPQYPTEAYYLALLDSEQGTHYFTLELGTTIDGNERTVLCAWTADNKHFNYGDGPSAVKAEFIEAVRTHLNTTVGHDEMDA